jgi:pimeloyl-ACP methyl ester carboxylesterase
MYASTGQTACSARFTGRCRYAAKAFRSRSASRNQSTSRFQLATSRDFLSLATRPPPLYGGMVSATPVTFVSEGRGAPVVFVHGGVSDHRAWEAQRSTVARYYRFLAIDLSYFGEMAWPDDGSNFSQTTHIADLARFVESLDCGPVDVVAHSYGAVVALGFAVKHPMKVRSLFINEPPLPSILTDPADRQLADEERKELLPASEAASAGNVTEAARLFVDWINGEPGSFDALPASIRTMHLDNARTLPRQLNRLASTPITGTEVSKLEVPVVITKGALTRPYFRVIAEAVHRCIAGSRLVTIAGAQHRAPIQAPALFNQELMSFLAR